MAIAPGDTVTATYVDDDDGMGGTDVDKIDSAVVDCAAPVVIAVKTLDIEPRSATIQVTTDEPVQATVRVPVEEIAIGDATIPEGALVLASLGAALETVNLRGLDSEQKVAEAIATAATSLPAWPLTTIPAPATARTIRLNGW